MTWYSEDRILQWLQALRATLHPDAAQAHVPCHQMEDHSILPLTQATILRSDPSSSVSPRTNTTHRDVSSSLGVAPTPEYLRQTGHIISPAPLLKLANLSHRVGLTTTPPVQPISAVSAVKTKAARNQPPVDKKIPRQKKGGNTSRQKGIVKRKKGGGLKVKIQFPPISKEMQKLISITKESTSKSTSNVETVTSTTTALQMSPFAGTSPLDPHPTSTESMKSVSHQPSSSSNSSSGA